MPGQLKIRRLDIDDYEDIIRIWTRAGLPFRSKGRDRREMISIEMSHSYCAFFGLYENEAVTEVEEIVIASTSFDYGDYQTVRKYGLFLEISSGRAYFSEDPQHHLVKNQKLKTRWICV